MPILRIHCACSALPPLVEKLAQELLSGGRMSVRQHDCSSTKMPPMPPEQNPKRRWHQFSLRTFFVAVTIGSVDFGYWVLSSREWIRQRHEGLATHDRYGGWGPTVVTNPTVAPWGLWLFGEDGVDTIICSSPWDNEPIDSEEILRVRRLFPEAQVRPLR